MEKGWALFQSVSQTRYQARIALPSPELTPKGPSGWLGAGERLALPRPSWLASGSGWSVSLRGCLLWVLPA